MGTIVLWKSLVESVGNGISTQIEHLNQLRIPFHVALFSRLDVRAHLSLALLRNQRCCLRLLRCRQSTEMVYQNTPLLESLSCRVIVPKVRSTTLWLQIFPKDRWRHREKGVWCAHDQFLELRLHVLYDLMAYTMRYVVLTCKFNTSYSQHGICSVSGCSNFKVIGQLDRTWRELYACSRER
jgi:hypothetical protein